jgi:saccharopine dehydrogenase-like NADP-dependent oxidoreductase
MRKIIILGCGPVGKHIAIDLCKDAEFEVTSVDINREALAQLSKEHPIRTRVEDLATKEGVTRAVEDADIVIGAVPGPMGYAMLEAVIRAGKNIVDISYFLEDPFELDELAKEKGVTAVVDCGVAPGISNIILGDHTRRMKVNRYECYAGGIPKSRKTPLAYKTDFPVLEVFEELSGPGRSIEGGKMVERQALDETMTIDLPRLGTMACLNADGLRTLLHTCAHEIPNMFEKNLRYPEYVAQMRIFDELGFFSQTPIQVNGVSVRPIDVTSAIFTPVWKYEPGEFDLTIMRLVISGEEDGKPATYTYDLYDQYDPVTKTPSMARTTGYTCTAVTRLVLDSRFSQTGIIAPEILGRVEGCRESVEKYLSERGVLFEIQRNKEK